MIELLNFVRSFFLFLVLVMLLSTRTVAFMIPFPSEPPPPGLVHTLIAALSGSTGAFAAYPIDYVKSQLQTESGREKYSNGFDAAIDIVRNSPRGPLELYRGVVINILGIAPEKTIKLSANDFFRSAISVKVGNLPIWGEIFAGAMAGVCQVIVTNPLELVKVKMQTGGMTIQQCMAEIKSVGDLYRGAQACLIRDSIFSATLFPLYEHLKVYLSVLIISTIAGATNETGNGEAIKFWSDLIAGSLAAAPAAFIATPADFIKTRMQQARTSTESDGINNEKPMTLVEMTEMIFKQEGLTVFFSGSWERVVRSVPQFGVTLAMFDVYTNLAVEAGLLPIQA